jgi:hypothetical protein
MSEDSLQTILRSVTSEDSPQTILHSVTYQKTVFKLYYTVSHIRKVFKLHYTVSHISRQSSNYITQCHMPVDSLQTILHSVICQKTSLQTIFFRTVADINPLKSTNVQDRLKCLQEAYTIRFGEALSCNDFAPVSV